MNTETKIPQTKQEAFAQLVSIQSENIISINFKIHS
jgi:hypothetical protein